MFERIAKIERTTLGYEDHGIFTCVLHLSYGSSGQGAGTYSLDDYDDSLKRRRGTAFGMDWIIRAMKACGVDEWSKVKGRTVLAVFDSDSWNEPVLGIKPLPTEPGEPFMFLELAAEHFPKVAA